MSETADYYFCLTHHEVERGAGCRAADRMGPYPTAAAAEHWQESVDAAQRGLGRAGPRGRRGLTRNRPSDASLIGRDSCMIDHQRRLGHRGSGSLRRPCAERGSALAMPPARRGPPRAAPALDRRWRSSAIRRVRDERSRAPVTGTALDRDRSGPSRPVPWSSSPSWSVRVEKSPLGASIASQDVKRLQQTLARCRRDHARLVVEHRPARPDHLQQRRPATAARLPARASWSASTPTCWSTPRHADVLARPGQRARPARPRAGPT